MADREEKAGEVVEAARAWARARRAYEESSRTVERPANYSELKGNIRRAERALRAKIDALDAAEKEQPGEPVE